MNGEFAQRARLLRCHVDLPVTSVYILTLWPPFVLLMSGRLALLDWLIAFFLFSRVCWIFFFYSVVVVRSTFVESEVERSRNWCNLGRILNSPARNVEESSAGHPWNWFRFEDFPGLWNQIPTSGLVSTPHRFQRSRNNRANGLVPVCPDKFLWPLIWLVFTLMTVIRDRYTGSNRVKSIWSNLKR